MEFQEKKNGELVQRIQSSLAVLTTNSNFPLLQSSPFDGGNICPTQRRENPVKLWLKGFWKQCYHSSGNSRVMEMRLIFYFKLNLQCYTYIMNRTNIQTYIYVCIIQSIYQYIIIFLFIYVFTGLYKLISCYEKSRYNILTYAYVGRCCYASCFGCN